MNKGDVAVADVVAAYLKADMNDYTLLKFMGESVDIMCKMNPSMKNMPLWRREGR